MDNKLTSTIIWINNFDLAINFQYNQLLLTRNKMQRKMLISKKIRNTFWIGNMEIAPKYCRRHRINKLTNRMTIT